MPSLPFSTRHIERARGDLPTLPLENMFLEEAPGEETGVVIQSRPGLSLDTVSMGSGPVDTLFKRDSVLGGTIYGISGGSLYSGSTLVGVVDGDAAFSIAGYENQLFVAGGQGLWGYDGATLAQIAFPDDASVAKVLVGASRLVAIREDTGRFYWSDPLDDDVEALDFATAEGQPDRLLDMLFIDDILVLFGAETVEFWPNTGDATLPFQPIEARTFEKGIRATSCAVIYRSTFAWVGNDNVVYTNGQEPQPISDAGLEEKIAASATCRLFNFFLEGTEFLALRLDGRTFIYSTRTGMWSEFTSYGQDNWIPQCFAGGVFGSSIGGETLAFNGGHSDLGGELERRFRAGVPINGAGQTVNNLSLRTDAGQTPFLSGDFADPVVELRLSRNLGQTWGDWKRKSLGAQGHYRSRPQWRALGMASQPALLCEFRVTDPVPFRVTDVRINEPYGGR